MKSLGKWLMLIILLPSGAIAEKATRTRPNSGPGAYRAYRDKKTGFTKVAFPTTKSTRFKPTDFVFWLMYDRIPSIGMVTRVRKEQIEIMHFEEGKPWLVTRNPQMGSVRKTSRAAAAAHFKDLAGRLRQRVFGSLDRHTLEPMANGLERIARTLENPSDH